MSEPRNAEQAEPDDGYFGHAGGGVGRPLDEAQALYLAEHLARVDAEMACPNCGPKMRERQRENLRNLKEAAAKVVFKP